MWTAGIQIPKKFFRASTGFEPVASAFTLQCSTSWAMKTHALEAGQFIEFINPWNEWNTEWNDVNGGNANEMNIWKSQLNRNLSNCEVARKKFFGASTGFEPVASAFALQCSPSWAMKTHTLEAGQFIEFINPWNEWNNEWNDVNGGNTNEINISKSQLNRNLSNCEVAPKSFSGLQRDSTVASAFALQCSTSWAMKTHKLEAGQLHYTASPSSYTLLGPDQRSPRKLSHVSACSNLRLRLATICMCTCHFIRLLAWSKWTQVIGKCTQVVVKRGHKFPGVDNLRYLATQAVDLRLNDWKRTLNRGFHVF